jgi:hypothetical protein
MLVHVTRFNSVQQAVMSQVQSHLRHLKQRLVRGIDSDQILSRLHVLWENDFLLTSGKLRKECTDLAVPEMPQWEEVEAALPDAIADIEVRMINGTAKDALDYADQNGAALKVIAIGGDKLSRGLTLEGLCVSYFLRASRM